MALRFVDLHTHSTASDGSVAPAELVRSAHALNLEALALTDHDTLEGLGEAEQEARNIQAEHPDTPFEFIRGCELSSRCGAKEAHILGLWIDREEKNLLPLKGALQKIRQQRLVRNTAILEKLLQLGINLSLEEVMAFAGDEVVARPHIARALLQKGVVKSVREAFETYLGYRGKAYVPRELMTPEEAVSLLAESGATVVLAHPMLIGCPPDELEALIVHLKPYGLRALEAYHSEHSAADERVCVELAERHHLLLSGGSDFHGLSKPQVQLGKGHGGLRVSQSVLQRLKADREERGLPL